MRILFLLVVGLSSATAVWADCIGHNEGQMIGKVKEVLFDLPAPDTPVCESTVYIRDLNHNINCPLSGIDEGHTIVLNLPSEKERCKYKAGSDVSGVLRQRLSDGYVFLEE